jgi:hypothetical protein
MSVIQRIELARGYHALARAEADGQFWACIYEDAGPSVKGSSGWYPTADLEALRGLLAFVLERERPANGLTLEDIQIRRWRMGSEQIESYDAAHRSEAAIMAELAQGTKDLGARATLCPVMLATIGLEWSAVQAVARSMAGAWRVNPTARAILEAVQRSGTGRPGSVEEC